MMSFFISPPSGKRFKDFLEKMRLSFRQISKTPPPLDISEMSALGKLFLNSASKLDALGK